MRRGTFSLGDRLQRQIAAAIAREFSEIFPAIARSPLPATVPLKLRRGELPIAYRSAIALKLAPQLSLNHCLQSPQAIAQHLAATWNPADAELAVTPSGLLDLRVTDVALANWLQGWADGTIRREIASSVPPNSSNRHTDTETPYAPAIPFAVQYAHARCQSLLRLGDREGWIASHEGAIVRPTPIPWLSAHGELILDNPAEAQLIAACVAVADAIATTPTPDPLRLLMELSGAFEAFSRDSLPLARSPRRLGLLSVTGTLLFWLLEVGLGVRAIAQM